MKLVSYKVALAIKDAGYPQGITNNSYIIKTWNAYYPIGVVVSLKDFPANDWERHYHFADIPTYLEVWLWLWREKKKWIDVSFSLDEGNWTFMQNPSPCNCGLYNDPEEAIEQAIEYLVDNDLIK